MEYISNTPIACTFCGAYIAQGDERDTKMRNGDILRECIWRCARCGNLARRDERVIKVPAPVKPVETKNEKK